MTEPTAAPTKLSTGQIVFIVIVGLLVLGMFAGNGSSTSKPSTTTKSSWCELHRKDIYDGSHTMNSELTRYLDECV